MSTFSSLTARIHRKSLEEAQAMARDAIANTVAYLKERNLPFPVEVRSERIAVEA